MKFLAITYLLFAGALAVPTNQCMKCARHKTPSYTPPAAGHGGNSSPAGSPPYSGSPGNGVNNPINNGNNPTNNGNNPANNGNNPANNGNNPANNGNNPANNGNNPANNGNNPSNGGSGSAPLCPAGLYSNAQCCGTDVLGLLDIDCKNPTSSPSNLAAFKSDCAKSGKSAKCCVLPIASQDVLCQDAA